MEESASSFQMESCGSREFLAKIKIRAGSGSTRREEEPGSCLVPRVRSARALVIAGDADEAVPPAASLECADWFEDAEVWTHAGGHHFPAQLPRLWRSPARRGRDRSLMRQIPDAMERRGQISRD